MLNPLEHRIIFSTPRRRTDVSAWREHAPFGMLLVDLLRPRVLVELGTHWGYSYCAFCQAVQELRLGTRCYAVDTWLGDPHAGTYGPEVLADLRAHHDPLYGGFSRLVESTFDDALEDFSDGSIDLLHIDGLHTYEAVKHDLESWLPRLSERGVIVLHDVNARRRGYGVWKLWEEVRERFPHFELHHAHGLGVLAVGPEQPAEFRELLETPPDDLQPLRDFLFLLGYRLRLERQVEDARRKRYELRESLRESVEAQKEGWRTKLNAARSERDELQAELEALRQQWPLRQWRLTESLGQSLAERLSRPRDREAGERGVGRESSE